MALSPVVRDVLFPTPPSARSRTRALLATASEATLDLLFPPHCVSCELPLAAGHNKALCLSCAEKMRWIDSDRCSRCGDGVGEGAGVVADCPSCRSHPPVFVKSSCAVARYSDGPLRDLILSLKFGRKLHVARALGLLLAARIRQTRLAEGAVLVPVPLTQASISQRGFNHTEEIARWIARELKARLEVRLLRKTHATPPQAVLTHEQRLNNLRGAFACDTKLATRYRDTPILLIDDVITTCGTVSECARTLLAAGVEHIFAASVARG